MKLEANHCSLVVLGAWNYLIFTPAWVAQTLRAPEEELDELQVEFGLNDAGPVLIFRSHRYSLAVTPGQLTLGPKKDGPCESQDMEIAEEKLLLILGKLPETPVRAYGVNVRVLPDLALCDERKRILSDTLEQSHGYQVAQKSFVARLQRERDQRPVITVRVDQSGGNEPSIDVNCHYEIQADEKCKDVVPGSVRATLGVVQNLASEVYFRGKR